MADEHRFEQIAAACDAISQRIPQFCIAGCACDDVSELERYHDKLAQEVVGLAELLREMALTQSPPVPNKGGG
jgi:hypothetical protein